MKVYLAGPMRGIPNFNFPEFFRYAHLLRKEGHEVFNPAEIGISQDKLREIVEIEMVWICRHAEAVALMPGWSASEGARAEAALARLLGLKLMGVPGFHPSRPLGKLSPSELEFSTTSHSHLLKSLKFPSQDKSNTIRQVGIGLSQVMKPMLLFAIFFSAGWWTAMGAHTLLRWFGVL